MIVLGMGVAVITSLTLLALSLLLNIQDEGKSSSIRVF
jgi:hypothetical protein